MFCDCHTHSINDKNKFIIDISENYQLAETVDFFSVGIHPKTEKNEVVIADNFRIVNTLAQQKNCVAIGECGFDKFSALSLDKQEQIFKRQILIAQEFKKPLIVHCVRLYSNVVRLLKLTKFNNYVVFHCYNGNPETTRQLLKFNNVFFSFSEVNTDVKCKGFNSLALIPNERILTESDCNKSSDFQLVINKIAKIKNILGQELEDIITQNFNVITQQPNLKL